MVMNSIHGRNSLNTPKPKKVSRSKKNFVHSAISLILADKRARSAGGGAAGKDKKISGGKPERGKVSMISMLIES